MKSKKGFTITELLAVLVLLGIILTLGTVTITRVRDNTLEKEYENLVSTIEVAAEKFASDTGVTQVIVETLINEGLLTADDESGFIYNPKTNDKLNCNVINISDGEASWTEEKTLIEGTDRCSTEVADNQSLKMVYSSGDIRYAEIVESTGWLRGEVVLEALLYSDKDNDGDGQKDLVSLEYSDVSWISPFSPDEVIRGKSYIIPADESLNDTFEVRVNYGGKQYTKTNHIRIDNTPPIVHNVMLKDPESWSPKKTISFRVSDTLSGIRAYQVTEEPNYTSDWVEIEEIGTKDLTLAVKLDFTGKESASIYIWALDDAGNVNKYDPDSEEGLGDVQIDIENIDIEGADSMDIGYSPKTYSQTVTITGKATDEKSGLVAYAFSADNPCDGDAPSKWNTFKKTNEEVTFTHIVSSNGTYYFWVKDDVGNTSCIAQEIDNIDRTVDVVKMSNPTSALTTSISLNVSGQDYLAGVKGWQVTTSNTKPAVSSSWNTSGISGKNFSSTYTIRSNGTYYLWVIDNANNIDGGSNKNSGGSTGSISISNIDVDAPTYVSGGNVSLGTVTKTNWTDASLPVTTYYYVSTVRSTPAANSSGWVQSSGAYSYSYSSTCGQYYYAYVKAVDALGNYVIRYLNSAYTGDCCSEGTYSYYDCHYTGYERNRKYNECTNQYDYQITSYACEYDEGCDSWGDCESNNRKYRTCYYTYAGRSYDYEDYKTCTYDSGSSGSGSGSGNSGSESFWAYDVCSNKGSCSSEGYKGSGGVCYTDQTMCSETYYCLCCSSGYYQKGGSCYPE